MTRFRASEQFIAKTIRSGPSAWMRRAIRARQVAILRSQSRASACDPRPGDTPHSRANCAIASITPCGLGQLVEALSRYALSGGKSSSLTCLTQHKK